MKKLFSTSLLVVVVICFSYISCKKEKSDPGICGSTWTTALTSQSNALSNAATVYATSPTPQNCSSFKTAYQNYLNALKPYTECSVYTAAQKTELANTISQAESEISTLCN